MGWDSYLAHAFTEGGELGATANHHNGVKLGCSSGPSAVKTEGSHIGGSLFNFGYTTSAIFFLKMSAHILFNDALCS